MVRIIKNKGREYLVVNTCIEIQDKDSNTTVPMFVQIELTPYQEDVRVKIYKVAYKLFNRPIPAKLIKQEQPKKAWWHKLIPFKK